MRFLRGLFSEKPVRSALLIDIASSSVGGMYLVHQEGQLPSCVYAKRITFDGTSDKRRTYEMISALRELGTSLTREGSVDLLRLSGRANPDNILVSVGSPWQKTVLRSESVREAEPFLFTKERLSDLLSKTRRDSDRIVVDDAVVSSAVNGYETRNLHRKTKVNHVRLVVASSSIEETLFREITGLLLGLYHMKAVKFISTLSLRYQALRLVLPHEHDFLLIDTIEIPHAVILVRRNIPLEIQSITGSVDAALTKLSHQGLVPERRFLFTEEDGGSSYGPSAGVRIHPNHLRRFFTTASVADIPLLMMGLYFGAHGKG